eukprot:10966204-Prorocentrum_lima.AAC.1
MATDARQVPWVGGPSQSIGPHRSEKSGPTSFIIPAPRVAPAPGRSEGPGILAIELGILRGGADKNRLVHLRRSCSIWRPCRKR